MPAWFLFAQVDVCVAPPPKRRLPYCVGDLEERTGRDLVRVGVGCPLSANEPDPGAAVDAGNDFLDPAVLADKGKGRAPLDINICVLAPAAQRFFQDRGIVYVEIYHTHLGKADRTVTPPLLFGRSVAPRIKQQEKNLYIFWCILPEETSFCNFYFI